MDENQDTIVVFTARSPERIVREGGSQSWVLNAARAKQCKWLVCTQNCHHPNHEFSDASEPHGSAFLLGRICGIRKPPEDPSSDRWQIAISEFARISVPNAWDHSRNPVRYTTLSELRINLDETAFQPMPQASAAPKHADQPAANEAEPMLTIVEAKKRLAATFGVKPEAVEITIRG